MEKETIHFRLNLPSKYPPTNPIILLLFHQLTAYQSPILKLNKENFHFSSPITLPFLAKRITIRLQLDYKNRADQVRAQIINESSDAKRLSRDYFSPELRARCKAHLYEGGGDNNVEN